MQSLESDCLLPIVLSDQIHNLAWKYRPNKVFLERCFSLAWDLIGWLSDVGPGCRSVGLVDPKIRNLRLVAILLVKDQHSFYS